MRHSRLEHLAPRLVLTAALALAIMLGGPVPGAITRDWSTAIAAAPRGARDLAPADPATVGFSTDRLARLTAGMRKMVTDNRLAGVVTLMARHGKVVSFDAFGKQDIRKPDPMAKDSIFRIYSMTKPITGVAMMLLYEEGKWRLDDPVSKYIPEFAGLKVHAGENADGTPKLDDLRRPMTMRELMTHSAGLGYGLTTTNPVDRMYREARVLDPTASLGEMVGRIGRLPLLAQPGTRWSYSIAVDVQGYIVEKVSGRPFDAFLKERILRPAWHEGHGLLRSGREAAAARAAPRRSHWRRARSGPGSASWPDGRSHHAAARALWWRRALLDSRGLPAPLSDAAGRRRLEWHPTARTADGGDDADQSPVGRGTQDVPPWTGLRARLRGGDGRGRSRGLDTERDLFLGRRGRHLVLDRSRDGPRVCRDDPAPRQRRRPTCRASRAT